MAWTKLTKREKKLISKICHTECANWDYEYGCLPLDSDCYMDFIGFRESSHCKYFDSSILPAHPELQELLNKEPGILKNCLLCGSSFVALRNKKYCSESCASKAQKRFHNKRMRHFRRHIK